MLVLAKGACGCLRLINVAEDVLIGAYINETSDINPNAEDYKPYISETLEAYYVPEDYNEMSQPRYHSEDATAPSLNSMALFVGIQDNGDGTFTNYNFTPAQLASYVIAQSIIEVDGEGGANVTNAAFSRPVMLLNDGQQTYNRAQFTQAGTTITMTNGVTFYTGQLLTATLA